MPAGAINPPVPTPFVPAPPGLPRVERRRRPRIETACNALVRLSRTLTFRCRVLNLTLESCQILCDPRYALLIHPDAGQVERAAARAFEISIALPFVGATRGFTTGCRARYCTTALPSHAGEGEGMVVGLEFETAEPVSRQLLADYLDQLPEVSAGLAAGRR